MRKYRAGRWRERKGLARVHLADGSTTLAEVHWSDAHGFGRVEMKIEWFPGD